MLIIARSTTSSQSIYRHPLQLLLLGRGCDRRMQAFTVNYHLSPSVGRRISPVPLPASAPPASLTSSNRTDVGIFRY